MGHITFLSDSRYNPLKVGQTATSKSIERVSWEVIPKATWLERIEIEYIGRV